MKKIKVIFNYNLCEEDDERKFEDIDGDLIGETMGQESSSELINSLDELDGKKAVVQLVDENDKVIKEKKIKINF